MSTLTDLQESALRAIVDLWGTTNVVLVGDAAVAVRTGMPWRTTRDVDPLVTVGLAEVPQALGSLPDWRQDARVEHRWWFRGRVLVDIVPVSPAAIENGVLIWPRSGNVMNVEAYDLVFRHAEDLEIGEDRHVRIPPLPVLVLLKMISFCDEPYDRGRDLADVAWMLDGYVDDLDERRFEGRLYDLGLDYDQIPAFLLGEDLRAIAGARHLRAARDFLKLVKEHWLLQFAARGPVEGNRDADVAARRLGVFERGLTGEPP